MLGRLFGRSKHDAGKSAPDVQEEVVDAGEPSTDPTSNSEPFVVSPNFAKDIMLDLPDRSAEDAASIVNDLALNDVSKSSPKPAGPGKRKRHEADVEEDSPNKRIAKEGRTKRTRDEPTTTSTNGITGHGGRANRTLTETVKVAPKALGRPKKEQPKRHLIQIYPAVQKRPDIWTLEPSPEKQIEESPPTPTKTTEKTTSSKAAPRPRGRPPRVGPPPTQKMTSMKRRQPHVKVKPRRKGRPEGYVSPEPKARSNARPNALKNKPGDRHTEPARRSTRSTAATNGRKEEEDGGPERERGKDSEETVDRDGRTLGQMGEREEGNADAEEAAGEEAEEEDSDFEGPSEVYENDDGEEEEEMELLGQDVEWKIILEGARSTCDLHNRMPRLLTESIRGLVNDVREARVLYEELLSFRGVDHDSLDGHNDQLRESLDAIEGRISSLSEEAAATEGSKMIRDIYARAIPAMVFLLQSALASRVYHSDKPCELEAINEIVNGLTEIVRLQTMTILLCEKASRWKATPVLTSLPIKFPTTRKMFPNLRYMRKAFSMNLAEQQTKRKARQNAVDYSKRQTELAQSVQQAKQDAVRKKEKLHDMIRASRQQEDELRRLGKRTLRQIKEDETRARMGSPQVNGHVESRARWSNEEDLALYFQLEKGYAGALTTEERYLNILNTRDLQHKLPEHIRERALYFKPTLLEERGALEWISSIG